MLLTDLFGFHGNNRAG